MNLKIQIPLIAVATMLGWQGKPRTNCHAKIRICPSHLAAKGTLRFTLPYVFVGWSYWREEVLFLSKQP
jgi:hypothetical protein